MSPLRERRHEQTKEELVAAALALIERVGYSAVTMEDIAAEAGVSRRTAYRRFPAKDDVILEVPRRWLTIWDERRSQFDDRAEPEAVLAACCRAVADYIDSNRTEVLVAYAALAEAPALGAGGVADEAWIRRVVEVLESHDRTAAWSARRRIVIAGAYLGAIDAVMAVWAEAGGRPKVRTIIEDVIEAMAPVLDS